jgi:hypothetical protein
LPRQSVWRGQCSFLASPSATRGLLSFRRSLIQCPMPSISLASLSKAYPKPSNSSASRNPADPLAIRSVTREMCQSRDCMVSLDEQGNKGCGTPDTCMNMRSVVFVSPVVGTHRAIAS